jgi:hypothetical protein
MRLSEDVIRYLTVKYDGQHTSLGRSTTPVASTETSTTRTEREPREPVAASAPAGDDD